VIFPSTFPHSTKRVFSLALGRRTEKFENLQVIFETLKPQFEAIRHKTWISKNGATITPEFWFCADAKFFLLALGLKVANSEFSCSFCLVPNTMWGQAILHNNPRPIDFYRHSIHALNICKNVNQHCLLHMNLCACHISKHSCALQCSNLLAAFMKLDEIVINELHLFMQQWNLHLNFIIGYAEAHGLEDVLEGFVFYFLNIFTYFLFIC
jgi:hypothetical protein